MAEMGGRGKRGNLNLTKRLIFIHGLNGDARGTWMMDEKDDSTLWPRWLASDVDCSVWVLGYDAKLSSWQDNAMPLPDQGDSVLETLATEEGLKNRPLLLIGHSMGGLVIKTLIHHGRTKGVARYESVVKRIRGVSFVATPHNGSQLATLAKYAAVLLRTNPQVGNMQTHDAHLRSLNQQFLAYFNAQDTCVAVRTFAETSGVLIGKKVLGWNVGGTKLVVDPDSSEPHVPGEIAVRLPEDHSSICKLASKNDQLYKSLLAFIKEDVLPKSQPLQQSDVETVGESRIHSDRLPTVTGGFVGRTAELQLLNDAWINDATRIVQFIAPGGTGKTKLLRHWLNHTIGISNRIMWSFHSQGFREDKQASATLFFIHAFEKLGSKYQVSDFVNTEDNKRENKWKEMGEHIAELLRTQRCVLVLDGLEPLQHAGRGMQGELKDSAIRQLLKSLAGQTSGLCIITTRIAVYELSDRQPPMVISHDLQNLSLDDGVLLLQSLGVRGSLPELRKAVGEFGCHALALNLLGNMLQRRYQGDVLKRASLRKLPAKFKGSRESRHAFKVMRAYEEWFADEPELVLLRLLGLFDHPVGQDVLQVLWDAQISDLTAGIDEDEWLETVATLRDEHHLLVQNGDGDYLDCHPLIREYFGQQLRDEQPKAWQQAHEALYEYYKNLPEKELPDTLAEMQPLFYAIEHGCHADLHQQAFEEIYWKRISREKQYYLNKKGFLGDDLAVLIHFFTKPWVKPSIHLDVRTQAHVLQSAGHRLRALGKLAESIKPFTAALKLYQILDDAKQIAITSSNLIEPQLTLGDVRGAMRNAQRAANSNDLKFIQRLQTFSIFARALHQAGRLSEAHQQFMKAEQIQRLHYPDSPSLHSLSSFRFCELLLEQNQLDEVEERAHYALSIALASAHPLYIGLHKLLIGHLCLLNKYLLEAEQWLREAFDSLQEAGNQDHLPRVYLARAELHRYTHDFARARQDLQEVFDIADGSGMRLHLTDYHLEMARLVVAEEENPPQSPFCKEGLGGISLQAHIEAAAKLIKETGYHRRDQALLDLQQAIAKHETTVHPPTCPITD